MAKNLLLIVIAFGGGVTVGSAAAAFISILQVVPRLVQISNTRQYIKLYQYSISIGFILFSIIYFSDYHMNLNKYFVVPIGFTYGVFIGLFSSALAEVLNVIPILSKKLKIKDNLRYVILTLMAGKVIGALYFWLFTN